jgi:hypothetical protein
VVSAQPPIQRERDVTGYAEMIARVEKMWREGIEDDEEMAARLTQEGFHSARAARVLPVTVRKIRHARGWRYSLDIGRTELRWQGALTARGLAARLGTDVNWVYRRLYDGAIKEKYLSRFIARRLARQAGGDLVIADSPTSKTGVTFRLYCHPSKSMVTQNVLSCSR